MRARWREVTRYSIKERIFGKPIPREFAIDILSSEVRVFTDSEESGIWNASMENRVKGKGWISVFELKSRDAENAKKEALRIYRRELERSTKEAQRVLDELEE